MSFGENLKKARKDAEMTQSELAQRVGITERSVYNYEKNSRAPKVDIVEKFAQALGVPSEILMRGLAGESTSGQWNEKELEKLLLQIQLMFDSGLDERRKERFSRRLQWHTLILRIKERTKNEKDDLFSRRMFLGNTEIYGSDQRCMRDRSWFCKRQHS